MKILYHAILILTPFSSFSQTDNVLEAFDSLSKVYYYNKLELTDTVNGNNTGKVSQCSDEEYENRFNELNKNSPVKLVYNQAVKKYIQNYLNGYRSVAIIQSNSKYYFPKYEEALIKYSLPLELKYLSVVESALNPTAKSYCGAAGLWQFMPATGKAYGLRLNSYVDERYNIDLATDAACRYLKDLFAIYNDWPLAIAAYNCGPGNVNKAIKRSGGKRDFFSISEFLPKETQGYVPAYMAAYYVLHFSQEHNIPKVTSQIAFTDIDYIEINKTISINKLALVLQLSQKELMYLNPSYYIGIIPGNNDRVIIPKEKALLFIDKESLINKTSIKPNTTSSNDKPIKQTALVSPIPVSFSKKSAFNTIEINSTVNQEQTPLSIIKEVVLCEVINNFNPKTDEIIRVRNLKPIGNSIPANSVLLGKVEVKDGKKQFHFYSVANTKASLHYYAEFNGKVEEGDTIYLGN